MTEELQRVLWPKGHRPDVWAIVDAAQDQQIYWTLTNSFLPHSCLFAGALPEALEMAAPYLVQLDPDDKFTDYLAKNLANNVGVFLQCDASLAELRHHLRTFLTVKDTSGRRMLFRYYDPRVLRVYLPTCRTDELETVFGPVTTFWTVSDDPNTMTQFEFRGRDLRVTPHSLRSAADANGDAMASAIVPAQEVLTVCKDPESRHRVPVLLQGAGRGGLLRRSSAGVRFFRTVLAKDELPLSGGAYTIPAVQLDPDVTVYCEAAAPGEVTLTLEPVRGAKAETKILAVELALDTGGAEVVAGLWGASQGTRRRISVRPVEPRSFRGRLTLRTAPGGPALTLFTEESAAEGYPLADGFSFDAPRQTVDFWVEGAVASKHPGDASLQLVIEGSQAVGDIRPVTVVSIGPVEAEIPGTPSKSRRLPEVSSSDVSRENPLVLLAGAGGPIRFRTEVTPPGAALHWSVSRRTDDAEAILALSANPQPTLEQTEEGATMQTDAAGAFSLVAGAGSTEGWGGPAAALEVVLVHAALAEHNCSVNGRFCSCGRVPGTDQFRLHSGNNPAVQLDAAVHLTGAGPDARRGVEAIRGGWINNIVSDNAGARYKGGNTVNRVYSYVADGEEKTVDFEDGPILDADESRSMPAVETDIPPAPGTEELLVFKAQASPAVTWKIQAGAASDRPIEQIWNYMECRAYLSLWSAHAPEQVGVLLQTGWSFTGDYACNAMKITRPILPARLASTGTMAFPALTPAAQTDLEVHPPASGRGDGAKPE